MTLVALVELLRRRLLDFVESPALEAEILVASVLGMARTRVTARPEVEVAAEVVQRAEALAARRVEGEPIAYLIGEREFYGRRFEVGPSVLVPRPETEHLVEVALAALADARPGALVADVGTGSGIVAVTLALERPGALRCLAIDLSPAAAACARRNAAALGASASVRVVCGDLLATIAPEPGTLAAVVSNPPYVEAEEWSRLPVEVRKFEPRMALVPESGSAAQFRARLIEQAAQRLAPGGLLAFEVGAGQAAVARDQLVAAGFRQVAITNDLASIGRVVSARRAGA